MKNKPYFVIATTTYNMADTLHRTYRSIVAQTYRNFYWLIIDNGSSDETEQLAKKMIEEALIDIEYIKKEHGIRATALNMMLDKISGDLCVEVHADDELKSDCLDIFAKEWEKIPEEQKKYYWAMAAHCEDSNMHSLVGKKFPNRINQNSRKAWKYSFHTIGEKHYAMNVSLVKTKRFNLDVPPNITYIGEALLWLELQKEYLMWFVNKTTRIYYDDSPNRYTAVEGKQITKQARENAYYCNIMIVNTIFRFHRKPFNIFVKTLLTAAYNGIICGKSYYFIKRDLNSRLANALLVIGWIPLKVRERIKRKE